MSSIHLVGPSIITCLVNIQTQKRIYLMGEYHDKKSSCATGSNVIPIQNFLMNAIDVFERLPFVQTEDINLRMLDIFLEVPDATNIGKNNALPTTQYIQDLENAFGGCLIRRRLERCPKRTRLHFADIRRVATDPWFASMLIYEPYFQNFINHNAYNIELFINWLKMSLQPVFNNRLIAKQFDRGKHDQNTFNLAQRLKTQIEKDQTDLDIDRESLLLDFTGGIPRQYDFIEVLRQKLNQARGTPSLTHANMFSFPITNKKRQTNRPNILPWLVKRISLVMDAYLLGRLLKPYVRNAIVYTGLAHHKYCKEKLLSFGFQIERDSDVELETTDNGPNNPGFQCISLDKFSELRYFATYNVQRVFRQSKPRKVFKKSKPRKRLHRGKGRRYTKQ
jgi:hypothetical protein